MDDLEKIVRSFGGKVSVDGSRAWVPGPGHSRRDRSLSLLRLESGRIVAHSFANDLDADVVTYLRIAGVDVDAAPRPDRGRTRTNWQDERNRRANAIQAFCERLWSACGRVEGSAGQRYLESRAIDWIPSDVAFHARAPRGYSTSATGPALVVLGRSVSGAPTALQATFLTPDGSHKTGRLTFGAILGAAVRLAPAADTLAVGEGLETCASFSKLEGIATWATLGTANLAAFIPPARVRRLIIAADGDQAGAKAANALAEKLRHRCDVSIMPAPAGADWNDVAMGKVHV